MKQRRLRAAALGVALCATLPAGMLQAADAGRQQEAAAPRLDAKISCSSRQARGGPGRVDDVPGRSEFADSAEIHLQGDRIDSFRWESSLFRSTTGYECSIDDSDGLIASLLSPKDEGNAKPQRWRVQLQDARAARARRGYDADHGFNCSIRLERDGQRLHLLPSCPALCGSRENFSALTVDLQTGQCEYEH